jgi:Peroxidase, family 2
MSFTRSSISIAHPLLLSPFIDMLTKTFAPLLSALLLAFTVQALPQLEDTSADGPPRGPPQLVLDVPNPPPPLTFTGAMLVNDAAHPYRAPRAGDLRGPCPGLNTLANHGVSDSYFSFQPTMTGLTNCSLQWLPRDGVATPAQIITAVQEGQTLKNFTEQT